MSDGAGIVKDFLHICVLPGSSGAVARRCATVGRVMSEAQPIPEVLWSPPADVRERLADRAATWAGSRRSGARRSTATHDAVAVVGRRPRRVLVVDLGLLRRAIGHAARRRCSADGAMPGARWFPGATLNYAEHALRAGRRRRRSRWSPASQTRGAGRPDRRRAARRRWRARRAGLQRLGVGRGRPGGGLPAEHPRDAGGLPGHRQPRRDLVVVRAGVRHRSVDRPVRPDRADGAARRRRLPLRRPGRSTARPRSAAIRARAAAVAATVVVPYLAPDRRRRPCPAPMPGTSCSRGAGAARVRAGAVRPPALRPLLVGHDRACPSRSSTATAASCSST